MVNVVAATMGGVWALKLTGTPFSISAAVGFISIFGVAVQDGVLLISYFNQMRAAGLPVERVGDARRRAAGPAGGHDLADRRAGAVPGGHRRPRSARRRRSRWRSSWSAACSCTLFLTRYLMPVLYSFFPAPAGHGQCQADLIMGSHYTDRFLQPAAAPAGHDGRAPRRPRHTDDATTARPARRIRRTAVMKINWKLPVAVMLIAAGATGVALNRRPAGHVIEVWKQIVAATAHRRGGPPDKSWLPAARRSKEPWDRTAHSTRRADQGDRPGDGPGAQRRPNRRSCRCSARPITTRRP